jgi:mannose-6-phosphate isomerase-like protein (cupin superfamily)
MRILELGARAGRPNASHGSRGFSVAALGLTADAHLVVVRVAAGGVVGRHPAAGRQLLAVLVGDATVSGEDGDEVPIGPGQAAVWEPYEQHQTRTRDGLTALVLEGELDLA